MYVKHYIVSIGIIYVLGGGKPGEVEFKRRVSELEYSPPLKIDR